MTSGQPIRLLSTLPLRRSVFHTSLLCFAMLLTLLISTRVGALCGVTVILAARLGPLSFLGRWHPIRQASWCYGE